MGDGAAQLEGFITEASQGHAVEWVGGKLPRRLALSIPANAFSDKRHAWWAFFYRNHRTKLDLFFFTLEFRPYCSMVRCLQSSGLKSRILSMMLRSSDHSRSRGKFCSRVLQGMII